MSHIEPKVPLDSLDPGRHDPGYWVRFQDRAMRAASSELQRRRRIGLTLGDALLSWRRMAVPFAVTAAAVAALTLIEGPFEGEMDSIAGLEELLQVSQDGEDPLPSFLHTDEVVDRDLVLFAVEGF